MTVRFVVFQAAHLAQVTVQPAQVAEQSASVEGADILSQRGVALTGMRGDVVLACAGITYKWKGLGELWALVSGNTRPQEWVVIHRRVLSALEAAHRTGIRRIEGRADAGFKPACRMFEMLGFDEPRHLLRAYSPAARDCWLYARVRDEHGRPLVTTAAEIDRSAAA